MYIINIFFIGLKEIIKWLVNIIRYFFIGCINIITLIPRLFISLIKLIGKKGKINKLEGVNKLGLAVFSLSCLVYFGSVFLISKWYVQGLKIKYLSNDIINSTEIVEKEDSKDENNNDKVDTDVDEDKDNEPTVYYPNDYFDYLSVPFMEVDFNNLKNKNDDTVGWIKVEGTRVNYPIVQGGDNDYYLSHDFNKRNNIGGWIFADYRVDFENFGKNTIIYGQNMNNGTMFGTIPSMLYSGYLSNSDNYSIKVSTPSSNSIWKVFSVYTIKPETYYIKVNFKSVPFADFINTVKERSIYNFGIDVSDSDKVLTLSTCDNSGTKRVVIHAKMINIEYK